MTTQENYTKAEMKHCPEMPGYGAGVGTDVTFYGKEMPTVFNHNEYDEAWNWMVSSLNYYNSIQKQFFASTFFRYGFVEKYSSKRKNDFRIFYTF